MRNSAITWFCVLTLIFLTGASPVLSAQETPVEKILLKEVLSGLEEKFEVRFSYREQDLEDLFIRRPDFGPDLDQILHFLESQTTLDFRKLDERYIAIISTPEIFDLCGVVKDARTGEALVGATIRSVDSSRSAISGPDGRFQLNNVIRGSFLYVRYLGYEELTLKTSPLTGEKKCLSIFMEPAILPLKEAVVVNYLTSGITKLQDGSTAIDTERFGILPGQIEPDILQTVESLPGVESVNETISNINIRGGTSDQNLVLFDGIKMYLTGHFFGLISAFNPNLTRDVSVVKNGNSPRLNGGVSGTIEISSQDELLGEFSGGAGINLVSADAFMQLPLSERLELHVTGRRSINDLVYTPTYNNYFSRTFQDSDVSLGPSGDPLQHSRFGYHDASLKILYDVTDDHKLRFSVMQVQNDLHYAEFSSSSDQNKRSSLQQTNLAMGGTWRASWDNGFSTEAIGYLTQYSLNATNHSVETDQRLQQQNEVLETGFKYNTIKSITSSTDMLSGYQFYEVGVANIENLNNPYFSSTIKNVIRSHSVYSALRFSGETTFFRGGLRVNYLSKFRKFFVEPRLSFHQDLSNEISFKVQAEINSQTTSQIIDLQEDFLGVESRRWILSDNEVYPVIKGKQISSGFDFRAKGWYIDLVGYYKLVEGVSTSTQGFQDQHEFIKTSGSYATRGIELLINKKAGPLHAFLTYTFGKNHYHFEELNPEKFPNNFDIRHSFSMALNYSYSDFKFSLGGHLRSGAPYTGPIAGKETRREGNDWVVNYAAPNDRNLPNFFRVDFSSSYTLNFSSGERLKLGLGIVNILDRDNVINRYYRVDRANPNMALEINNTSLGFTPNASLRFTW